MRHLNRTSLIVPAAVVVCAAAILIDLAAGLGWSHEPGWNIALWSLLLGSAATYAARWAFLGESKGRVALAATLTVMVLASAAQPVQQPEAPTPRAIPADITVEQDTPTQPW